MRAVSCELNVTQRSVIVACLFVAPRPSIDYCNAVRRRWCPCRWWTRRRWRALLIRCLAPCRGAEISTPPSPASRHITRRRSITRLRRLLRRRIFSITGLISCRTLTRSPYLRCRSSSMVRPPAIQSRTTEARRARPGRRRRRPTARRRFLPVQAASVTTRTWRRHHIITTTISNNSSWRRPNASSAETKAPGSTTACWRARAARASSSAQCVETWLTRAAEVVTVPSISIIATSASTVASRSASRSAWDEKVFI